MVSQHVLTIGSFLPGIEALESFGLSGCWMGTSCSDSLHNQRRSHENSKGLPKSPDIAALWKKLQSRTSIFRTYLSVVILASIAETPFLRLTTSRRTRSLETSGLYNNGISIYKVMLVMFILLSSVTNAAISIRYHMLFSSFIPVMEISSLERRPKRLALSINLWCPPNSNSLCSSKPPSNYVALPSYNCPVRSCCR